MQKALTLLNDAVQTGGYTWIYWDALDTHEECESSVVARS